MIKAELTCAVLLKTKINIIGGVHCTLPFLHEIDRKKCEKFLLTRLIEWCRLFIEIVKEVSSWQFWFAVVQDI